LAVTNISGLGEVTTNFILNDWVILNDWDLYLMNTSGTTSYVSTDWEKMGWTSQEKSVNVINEKYVREDKIPRQPTFSTTIRIGFEIESDIANFNENLIAVINQGTKSSLGSGTGTRTAYGATQAATEYRAIRLVSTRSDGKHHSYTIPKCEISQNGPITAGGEEEAKIPLMFKAFFNPAESATASLYYENTWESGVSVTADVPSGYT
jgi:hypothetical protein